MFGMSLTEILVIVLIILVVLGPEKIPEVAKFIGKGLREVRKASNLLRDAVMLDEDDFRQKRSPGSSAMPAGEMSDAEAAEARVMRDPDPKRDVRVVEMPPVRPSSGYTAVQLSPAAPDVAHREVYLHVPYDETI